MHKIQSKKAQTTMYLHSRGGGSQHDHQRRNTTLSQNIIRSHVVAHPSAEDRSLSRQSPILFFEASERERELLLF